MRRRTEARGSFWLSPPPARLVRFTDFCRARGRSAWSKQSGRWWRCTAGWAGRSSREASRTGREQKAVDAAGFPVTILSCSETKRMRRLPAGIVSDGETLMRRIMVLLSASLITLTASAASAQNAKPRNLILFVPDGLRARIVTPQTAPAMADLRDKGVNFRNSHSLFPTFTTANASAMATGHYLGDTGDFSNTIYTGYPVAAAGGTVTPFLEVDPVLADVDEHFGGDYLNEETILKMARVKGFSTAALGKLGPTLIFDHTDKIGTEGTHSIVIDDSTGGKNGVPLSEEMKAALTKANLPLAAPSRGDNGKAGDAKTPGTVVPNTAQQAYFADVASKIVLPMFKARAKPFVWVFWSCDPHGSPP